MVKFAECTEFAPAIRLDRQEIRRQARLISKTPLLCKHLDMIPAAVLILNEQRQIVFANQMAASMLGVPTREALYGLRPGEALHCIHADGSTSGCGTTPFCRLCGSVKTILTAFEGVQTVEECHINPMEGYLPFDIRVTSSPYFFADERFVAFVIADISSEKRREVLERIFFHDVNNTLNVLLSTVELMPPHATRQENELSEVIATGVKMLVNEIKSQQSLLLAEDGGLALEPAELQSLELLKEIISLYRHYDCAGNKIIEIDSRSAAVAFSSDKSQLSRVIGNMLKNALEASSPEEAVTIGCRKTGRVRICFWVHNEQYMPQSIQDQIFSRSFSTKGTGRGVGTYSMKLLGERYLDGKVSFSSTPDEGTTFSIELPTRVTSR